MIKWVSFFVHFPTSFLRYTANCDMCQKNAQMGPLLFQFPTSLPSVHVQIIAIQVIKRKLKWVPYFVHFAPPEIIQYKNLKLKSHCGRTHPWAMGLFDA